MNISDNASGLNGKALNALIDFNFIVNSELGLIRFIQKNFRDERAFKLDILNKSDREILSLLYCRNDANPLSVITTEENRNDIDDLYKSFFDNFKEEIIHSSTAEERIIIFVSTAIAKGINLGINVSIAVEDELEEREIISHFGNVNIVYNSDVSSILRRDPFYVRDYRYFTSHHLETKISRKKIYMHPRQYSLNYLADVENELTRNNVYTLMGEDYRKMKEKQNGNNST